MTRRRWFFAGAAIGLSALAASAWCIWPYMQEQAAQAWVAALREDLARQGEASLAGQPACEVPPR